MTQCAPPRLEPWRPLAILALWILALGFYARELNHLFYETYGPFYDSLSYDLQLAQTFERVRNQGLASGIVDSIASQSTVFLPWVEACLIAVVSGLRRDVVVWIQLPWMFVLAMAAYRYFSARACCSPVLAFCLSLPLTAISAVFFFNGGLSDFRMDLLQYMLFGATCLLYLSLRPISEPIRLRAWALWGAMAGVTCLARATTPVYLIVVFGPLFIADVIEHRANLKGILQAYGIAGLSLVALAGWFYVVNFDRLYYYYLVWNPDANAHLPLEQSTKHAWLLAKSIGRPQLLFLGFSLALGAVWQFRQGRPPSKNLNWRALWCGVAPLAFLILRGAGLNPFVSMVSAAGILIFCEAPWIPVDGRRPRWMEAALIMGSIGATLVTAAAGIAYHTDDRLVRNWVPKSAAIAAIDGEVMADLDRRAPAGYRYSLVHLGSMNADVILNSLIFDRRLELGADGSVSNGHWTLAPFGAAQTVSTLDQWVTLPGASDADKVDGLVQSLLQGSDYLLLPTANSALSRQVYINAYSQHLRQLLLNSGQLTPLGAAITVAPGESVEWYRNDRRK